MNQTIAEKIFSRHYNKNVSAGDFVIADLDFYAGADGKTAQAIKVFESFQKKVPNPHKVAFFNDHFVPCTHPKKANEHKSMFEFAQSNGIRIFEPGQGVCHQLLIENGFALPGQLIAVADSHAPSSGAVNCYAVAVGSTELAALLATGKLWFKVPESIKIVLEGTPGTAISGKDIILRVVAMIGIEGANYQSIEFHGSALAFLPIEDRISICNMVVDIGAKSAIMEYDQILENWLSKINTTASYEPVYADKDPTYSQVIKVDIGELEPQVACPHSIDNGCSVTEVKNIKVDKIFIGSCTNGRLVDLKIAASILKGKKIKPGLQLLIAPASATIHKQAIQSGVIQILLEAGAQILVPACGPCAGLLSQQGVPADGDIVLSTANRNLKGRMGNRNADIYLSSPATAAASAITGYITDPREIMG